MATTESSTMNKNEAKHTKIQIDENFQEISPADKEKQLDQAAAKHEVESVKPDKAKAEDEEESNCKISRIWLKRFLLCLHRFLRNWGKILFSILEFVVFLCSLGFLVAGFTRFSDHVIWVLEVWRWCVLVMVIVGGRHFMRWMMQGIGFLIKESFVLVKWNVKYSYYIYGLGNCIGSLLWSASVLITWHLLLDYSEDDDQVKRSKVDSKIVNYISTTLGAFLIGQFLWVAKTLLVNILTSSFQVKEGIFTRIRKSFIDQYILETLIAEEQSKNRGDVAKWIKRNKLIMSRCPGENVKVIDWILERNSEELYAWPMEELIGIIRSCPELHVIITEELESRGEKDDQQEDVFAKSNESTPQRVKAFDLIVCAMKTRTIIYTDHIRRRFRLEAECVIGHIGKGTTKSIVKGHLRTWLFDAMSDRRLLAHSLSNLKVAMEGLNMLVTWTVLVLLIVIWLLMMRFLTTEILVVILTQFLALVFMFGNTAKSTFEGIIFIFVTHPFDIGDRCLINKEEMVVERLNLMTTVFRKNDDDKIIYPNSVLTGSQITLLEGESRSSILDSVQIRIPNSTSDGHIKGLKEKIKEIKYWSKLTDSISFHKLVLVEIEDGKLKMVLHVSYPKGESRQDSVIKAEMRDILVSGLKEMLEMENIEDYDVTVTQAVDVEEAK